MRKLYIKQKVFKITDHYPITDSEGRECYYVDQDFRFIGHTVHLAAANGQRIFTVDRQLFKLLPRYLVHFTNGQTITLQSRFTFLRRRIDILSDSYNLTVEGNFMDLRFSIYNNGIEIGSIKRAYISWGDTFELTILDERFETVVIAVMIAIDRLIDEQQNSNN